MSFFRSSFKKIQNHPNIFSGVQQWSFYPDLAIQSGHCTISSELVSLRHSRLHRSLYNLIYTPNDELHYFIHYMKSCSWSSHLNFILDVNKFEKIIREKSNDDQQTIALALFHQYLSINANCSLPINDEIRQTTLLLICPSADSTKPDVSCFQMAREHVWELSEQSAYPSYLESSFHINYQLKMLTSDQLQLHDLLYDHFSLSYFIKFVEQENIIDLLRFWMDAEDFYQHMVNRDWDNQTSVDNALTIYDQYISLQASCRLGFDDTIRANIECNICQSDADAGPSIETFDQTTWIIYVILQREYFPRFLQSVIFYRYISDMMLKLRNADSTFDLQRTKTFESGKIDCKIGTTSTELENVIESTISNHQRNSSASLSCLSLHQETSVPSRGRFSMGYIDPLGRFIRDPNIDSIESFSSSNRRTSANPLQFITQLIRNEQDEIALDEAATRFAETIIHEITNRTTN